MNWWNKSAAPQEAEAYDDVSMPQSGDTTEPINQPARLVAYNGPPNANTAIIAAAATLAPHPIVAAAAAKGITTEAQFNEMHAAASAARSELQEQAQAEAVRCFGPDSGAIYAKVLEKSSYADAKQMTALWRDTADAKFGIGKNGEAPARQTDAADHKDFAASAEGNVLMTAEQIASAKAEGVKAYENRTGKKLAK